MTRVGRRARHRGDRGAAVVDVVLVLVVLVPLVLGVLQVALVMHVRNTMASAGAEGARYAAALGRTPADGVARTRVEIDQAVSARYADDIDVRVVSLGGVPTVRVVVRAQVPALGLGGPAVDVEAVGHALLERP
ncbi:TadE/TadG family type IV pilus assembly protein [Nocardioides sp. R-C-SC26]|uniref:TadE/TadG family type IV pilus assembly protein n=1 Tax=Nocardioides sp. R-C-SC26 TaxID=2870414 RepID=UPI001E567408|nr:TadE/TadG family type IV pilus assembly protein [Nocardioides sp. R-C-SC26]